MSHKNLNPSVPGRPKRRHRAVEPGRVVDHRLAGRVLVVGAHAPLLQVHRGRLRGRAVQPQGGRCEADAMSDPEDPSGWQGEDVISRG